MKTFHRIVLAAVAASLSLDAQAATEAAFGDTMRCYNATYENILAGQTERAASVQVRLPDRYISIGHMIRAAAPQTYYYVTYEGAASYKCPALGTYTPGHGRPVPDCKFRVALLADHPYFIHDIRPDAATGGLIVSDNPNVFMPANLLEMNAQQRAEALEQIHRNYVLLPRVPETLDDAALETFARATERVLLSYHDGLVRIGRSGQPSEFVEKLAYCRTPAVPAFLRQTANRLVAQVRSRYGLPSEPESRP